MTHGKPVGELGPVRCVCFRLCCSGAHMRLQAADQVVSDV